MIPRAACVNTLKPDMRRAFLACKDLHRLPRSSPSLNTSSTTVVSKWQEAGSLVFGSGKTGRGIGAVFASQTKAEDAPDYASRATATE